MADRDTATITHIDVFHAFALNEMGVSYFIRSTAISPVGRWGFAHLRVGSTVRLTPIDHPKGPRGIDVEIIEI